MKKHLSLLAMMLICTLPTFAHDFEVDGIYYNKLGGDSVVVTFKGTGIWDYTGEYAGSVTIPESVVYQDTTYKVTAIHSAFYYCTELTSVNIPASITSSIDADDFEHCHALAQITVASDNKAYHSAGNCLIETATKKLIVGTTNSVIPDDGSVTTIGYHAFYEREQLTSITIPNSITTIESSAFWGSGLTSVTIPDNVTSIGTYSFAWCDNLLSVVIGDGLQEISESAFSSNHNLT